MIGWWEEGGLGRTKGGGLTIMSCWHARWEGDVSSMTPGSSSVFTPEPYSVAGPSSSLTANSMAAFPRPVSPTQDNPNLGRFARRVAGLRLARDCAGKMTTQRHHLKDRDANTAEKSEYLAMGRRWRWLRTVEHL